MSVALDKVEVSDRKGMDIPRVWGVDALGKVRRQRTTCTMGTLTRK